MKKMVDVGLHAIKKSDRVDGVTPEDKRYSIFFKYDENLKKFLEEFVTSFSKWLESDIVLWMTVGHVEEKEEENDTRES